MRPSLGRYVPLTVTNLEPDTRRRDGQSERNELVKESTAVAAHQFRLPQDMALHVAFNFSFRGPRFQIQLCIERVELEEIAVRTPRRRARPSVADLAEVVAAL